MFLEGARRRTTACSPAPVVGVEAEEPAGAFRPMGQDAQTGESEHHLCDAAESFENDGVDGHGEDDCPPEDEDHDGDADGAVQERPAPAAAMPRSTRIRFTSADTRARPPTRPTSAPVTLTEAWGRIDRCHVRQLAEVSVLASDLPAVRIPNSPMATASHRVPWLCIRAALISTARPPETPASDASEVSNALPTNPASHVANRAGAEALPVQPAEEGEHAGVVDGCDRGRREARQQVAVDDLWLPRV